ncbi:hypothetical protein SEA_BIG4_193 [Microbacterium phage Big4]|nr:hypothetical protein SEA_BIG4_193 [Microbacterium phage Big4]
MIRDQLTREELEALRRMPEFKLHLQAVKDQKQRDKDEARRQYEKEHTRCEGGRISSSDTGYACMSCGIVLKFKDWADKNYMRRLLEGPHWLHANGGNPAREDGLSGKAAAAADGDWYASH